MNGAVLSFLDYLRVCFLWEKWLLLAPVSISFATSNRLDAYDVPFEPLAGAHEWKLSEGVRVL